MNDMDKRCIRAYAAGNMRATRAMAISGISRDTLNYHLSKVERETGYSPFEFAGLANLMIMVGDI